MSKNTILILACALTGVLAGTLCIADEMVVYPKKGQSEKQQEKDKSECYSWAKKQTGIDPELLVEQSTTQQQPQQGTTGGAVKGAGKGAAVGAIGGAVTGNAGKGAAAGAAMGGAVGVHQKRQGQRELAEEQKQAQSNVQEKMASFKKAQGACLEGRNYTVTQ